MTKPSSAAARGGIVTPAISAATGSWREPRAVLKSLAGSWVLDRSADNGVSMTGTATIAGRGEGRFTYHERVRLLLTDGQTIEGERRYIFEECHGGFRVLFAESPPRLFHRIVLNRTGSALVGSGVHLCGEDRYDSRYEFRSDGSFAIQQAVRGPRKHYTIDTHYSAPVGVYSITTGRWLPLASLRRDDI